jgi:surface protein
MYGMFYGSDFNQDIGGWDTSQVTNMAYMFAGDKSFDQNLSSWNIGFVTDMTSMFDGISLSRVNYDSLLNGWAAQSLQSGVIFSGGTSQYTSAALSARNDTLIGIYGWVIYDGGMLFSCVNDTDCGTCQKCNVGTGDCVVQNSSEDLKNECSQYIDACLNLYTQSGPNGYCDGAGACDANSYQQNVSAGNVCYSSMDAQPDITTHCGIWSDCLLHNTMAPEYYVGFVGDGTATCVATDWQSAGTFQSASLGYWWSATGQMDTCSETAFCSNDADCGFCQKCDVGTGVCGYQSSSEDAKGQCDPGVYSCSNAYTYAAATGFCNGAGSCDAAQSHVSLGKVCINSTAYDAAPTSSIKCGVWSDCLLYNITAPEYYVGYYSSGTSCDATGWQPAGTYQSSDPGYRWDVTGAIDQCTESVYCTVDSDCSACKKCDVGSGNCVNQNAAEDIKGDCTAGLSGCFNIGIKSGPDGLCNGYGSCDTNSNRVNVALGKVCLAGADVDPSAAAYCGIWSDCAYHATSAPEYYVGVKGDGTTVCNETGWVSVGTTQNASPGYWWAYAGKVDQCMPELSGGCAIDSDCGPCRVCSNFTCVNELATQDTKNDCTAGFNACADSYTRIGPNGLCNGAGSCDVNSNVANVSENRICYNGEDRLPCGFWDYCLSHDTSAQRYSTGIIDYVDGNEVCIETGWAPFGNSYPAAGYYWATTELREASGTAVQCAQIPIPDYCFSDDDCSFCNKCVDGACVNETGEDVKNECAADSCFNAYTFYGTSYTGLCDGTGNCQISNGTGVYTNVSKGKVCVNGSNSNPTSGVNCGVWSNCYWGTSVANEYYVGYLGDGTLSCSYNDVFGAATWVSAGTIQNATPLVFSTPSQYSPQQIDQCTEVQCVDDAGCGLCQKCSANVCVPQTASEDLKDQCTVAYDSCLTNYILQSSHGSGYCNGAGACDNSTTGYKNVSTGNVCIGGNDTAPTAGVHCDDKWSDCVRYATIAPEYYVGYVGTGVNICNPSNWVAAGTNQTVISGFWDATGRFESCNAVGCSQDTDCGFCNKCVAGSCVLENSTEDTKNQCPIHYSSCTNAWTLHGADSTGTCNGAGACNNVSNPLAEANVTIGNVCQSGLDTNPNLTVHCGIWSNCQLHGRTAPEYYVGYRGNGSDICVSTDWKYTGTNQIATTRYWWSSFGYMDNCTEEKACSLPNTGTVTYGIYPAYDDCYINKLTFENNIVIDCNGYSLIKNGSQNVMLNMVNNKNVSIYNCGIVESTGSRQPLYLNNAHDILLQNDTYLYLDTPSADLFVAHNSSIALRDSKFSDFVVDMDGASVVDYANNVINETGTVHLRLTSNGGTSVMMMHDSNFTANTLHFTIKRTVNGDNFTLYFYNNTMTANHVEYPIFGDSMTTPNVADFFSNRYYVGDVTLYPAISDPMATLFDINLTGWFGNSNDLFTNKVNLNVTNDMVSSGNASSDRRLIGDGLVIYDTYLESDANLTLVDFVFNNSIYDFGNGTYVNNTILYVNQTDIVLYNRTVIPNESSVVIAAVPVIVTDEFSDVNGASVLLNNNGTTKVADVCNFTGGDGACVVQLDFYDPSGIYHYDSVNITDRFGATPTYEAFGGLNYYGLIATSRNRNFVTFSGPVVGLENVKCDVPVRVVNTGNQNIRNITLTAYDLIGSTDPAATLPARYFRAGKTLADSVQLVDGEPVQLTMELIVGEYAYQELNIWVSAPANTTPQYYYPLTQWTLNLNP